MRRTEKCRIKNNDNNYDNPLTCADGGEKQIFNHTGFP